jgi:NSS family neurotransmitter:Na+ symporter
MSLVSERFNTKRKPTSWVLGALIALFSVVIIFNFGQMFGLVATIATQYFQPVAALLFTLFGGWVWSRNSKLKELSEGCPEIENSLFWKVWPLYLKVVCPILVATVLWASFG